MFNSLLQVTQLVRGRAGIQIQAHWLPHPQAPQLLTTRPSISYHLLVHPLSIKPWTCPPICLPNYQPSLLPSVLPQLPVTPPPDFCTDR